MEHNQKFGLCRLELKWNKWVLYVPIRLWKNLRYGMERSTRAANIYFEEIFKGITMLSNEKDKFHWKIGIPFNVNEDQIWAFVRKIESNQKAKRKKEDIK